MKRFPSIKKNSEFQQVYRNGKSYANKLLIMYISRSERPDTRIGISVRESFRLHKDEIETGLDIVVVARQMAKESDFKKIESAYLHLCGLHNILRESK